MKKRNRTYHAYKRKLNNLTGAGMLTDDPLHILPLIEWIDSLYLGDHCHKCQRRKFCPDPIA